MTPHLPKLTGGLIILTLLVTGGIPLSVREAPPQLLIDPALEQQFQQGHSDAFWVILRDKASLSVQSRATLADRRRGTVAALQGVADSSQKDLRAVLLDRGVPFRSYWIVNALYVEGDRELLDFLTTRQEVRALLADEPLELVDGASYAVRMAALASGTPEWNIAAVGAPQIWKDYGTQGEGIVIGVMDTGVQYDHPALARQYRGYGAGAEANHNYNWFDATASCDPVSVPCDDMGHGTHVAGIATGQTEDSTYQIGVAPGAKWIAAKVCDRDGQCAEQDILDGAQWMLEPTDSEGQNPRPELAPEIINNSWGGPHTEGDLQAELIYQPMVESWVSAGIFPVFSAGNYGASGCDSAGFPAYYPQSFAVGATDQESDVAGFSSRGPSPLDGSFKPDIVAPGVSILSSYPGNAYRWMSGTSMAAPHVAGAVALLWSEYPELKGDVAATMDLLRRSARNGTSIACGGDAERNNLYGDGMLNLVQAFHLADLEVHGYPYQLFLPLIQYLRVR